MSTPVHILLLDYPRASDLRRAQEQYPRLETLACGLLDLLRH